MATIPGLAGQAAARLGDRLGRTVLCSELRPGAADEVAAAAMAVLTGEVGGAPTPADVDDFVHRLAAAGLQPEFAGRLRSRPGGEVDTAVTLLRGTKPPLITPAPDNFKVIAIITAYNEADVIEQTMQHLIDNGVGVYLVDNWSVDETLGLARQFEAAGLVGFEQFPPGGRSSRYEWSQLLARVEQLARDLDADWIISNDADELRDAPWPDVSLRDALYHVQESGSTAVNHVCLNFALTQDTYSPGAPLAEHLTWFLPEEGDLGRVNAWARIPGDAAEIAWSGGHKVRFRGLRVFPYNFTLRHYPIRSVAQGRQKVFKDRLPRYTVEERLLGWHSHYDHLKPESLVRPTNGLLHFDSHFHQDYLLERLTGVALDGVPAQPSARLRAARALRRAGLLEPTLRLWWRLRGRAR